LAVTAHIAPEATNTNEELIVAPTGGQPLLVAENLVLDAPVFIATDRRILRNPATFLADLYLSRTRRGVSRLIDGVSMTLAPGMRLGLIGRNGAGKSTLLRLCAGIYHPSSGSLSVNGQIIGLFDASLGMNNFATGLENIYLRGLQMGLTLKDIRDLVPDVVEFSELGDAINQPLETYSSGMRMRLAGSISTMVQPDILLLDEWIGVGDARFGEKMRVRMKGLTEGSRALMLATHNAGLMLETCTHGLVLDKGRTSFFGIVDDALRFYKEADETGETRK